MKGNAISSIEIQVSQKLEVKQIILTHCGRPYVVPSASAWSVDRAKSVAEYASTVLYLPTCVVFLEISARMRRVVIQRASVALDFR